MSWLILLRYFFLLVLVVLLALFARAAVDLDGR